MRITSWVKWMGLATVTALIYIHMQMQIVELAYHGRDKEKKIHDLMDNNGILTHQILVLKSATHLGRELLEKDEGLQFMGHDRVVTLASPQARRSGSPASSLASRGGHVALPVPPTDKPRLRTEHSLWNWLSFLSPQEARAWDK